MLTREENEQVTKVGAGTPMGEALRRYWLPAMLHSELPEPDCTPIRLRLLGEDLVAFRDTNGDIGVLDENCPHRLASLWLGRNEEAGLRCVYHGWKYDVHGNCIEQMNEPVAFKDKIKVKAYPAVEMGDVIWVYMGPAEKKPPLPNFEYTRVPETHRGVTKVVQECNWLQALEGGIDSSHAPILHRQLREGASAEGIQPSTPFVRGGAPTLEVDVTDYGYRYTGIRPLDEDEQYVRGYHFHHAVHPAPAAASRPRRRAGPNNGCRPPLGSHRRPQCDGLELPLQLRRGGYVGEGADHGRLRQRLAQRRPGHFPRQGQYPQWLAD